MKKKNVIQFVLILIILISVVVLIYSSFQVYEWYQDSKNIKDLTEQIEEKVEVQAVDEEQTQVVEQPIEIEKTNPYWDYIKMNLIDVNFSELLKTNSDTVGWIQVSGTNINYPFVQTSDNKYYLRHAFDKSFNYAGWVFLDYRNQLQNMDQNTIIYAHGRIDNTMFGSLKNSLNQEWYQNKENHVIKLSTQYENTLWQVFSIYHIPTTSDYLETNFHSDNDFLNFVDMLQKRSSYSFDTTVNANDKILTLSTCYNDQEKMVMHAKLIKYSKK